MLDLCLWWFLHAHIRGMLDLDVFGGFYMPMFVACLIFVFGGFYMRTFVACLILMSLVASTCAHVRGMLDLYVFGGFYMRTFVACLIFVSLVVSTCAHSWHT